MQLSVRSKLYAPNPTIWPRWPLLMTVLLILFIGPIIAPLFLASELPLLTYTGGLAREVLANYICPTPQHSYLLAGYPMAVCARCWGATIGLWGAWWLVSARFFRVPMLHSILSSFHAMAWILRLLICILPFLLWSLEIIGTAHGWWQLPLWVLVLNDAQAGFAAGLFFYSLWPGLWLRTT